MTPNQFCLWLHGYASAKPEVLDPKVRDELDTVIAGVVASKLSGVVDDAYERDFHMGRQYALETPKMEIANIAPPNPGWTDASGLGSGGVTHIV